ncbi:MAG: PD-(D/E)XK nuclease family protein [Rikenellaceae bacterium]
MKFLSQIASAFYSREGQRINEFCFVFPNRRAGIFFQKYIGEITTEPLFSPAIITIKDLFTLLSGINPVERLDALYKLYKLYAELSGSKESFDDFIFWGDVILSDFDDVDKYMTDAEKLFANINDLKDIENDYSFLSKKQQEAVQTFWSNFLPVGDSEKKIKFRAVWELLYPLYVKFKDELKALNIGYEGMIYRKVAEAIQKNDEDSELLFNKIAEYRGVVFIGFNALTPCEKTLMKAFKNRGFADFYWDFEGELIRDTNNKASLFMRENITLFPSKLNLDFRINHTQEIEVIGIPSAVGEAKMVSEIIKKIGGGLNTAVVLPDESLLMPILNSIPEEVEAVNVTMGYPLRTGSIVSLMESIMELQKGSFYYKRVLPVLKHHYVKMVVGEEAASLINKIVKGNMVYIDQSEFDSHPLLKLIFRHTSQISDYLLEILEFFNKSVELTKIEKEFIYFFYTAVSKIRDLMIPMNIDTYCKVLLEIVNSTSIPFKGEPLSGLQIMGVLETRALDFENVIICSMNDGIFPSKSPENSFIPYNLRKGFAIPDYEFKDGMAAYLFYRLIYRAKKIYLLYDTRSEGLKNGEISRFVHQLKYHYRVPMKESIETYSINSNRRDAIVIEKSPELAKKIEKLFLKGGENQLSATSINAYIDCPLKFYFQFVKGVAEEESVSEGVEADTFGSIFHKAMELLYSEFKERIVTREMLSILLKQSEKIEKKITEAFQKVLNMKNIKGHNLLIHKLINKYIEQTIKYDISRCPFEYISSEQRCYYDFTLENGMVVTIKGFIDRIDRINGVQRIVDYKTGSGSLKFRHIPDLFDGKNSQRNKIALQMILYALMLYNKENLIISPYLLRELFKDDSNLEMIVGEDILTEFSDSLNATLIKIFDSDTPFVQTEDSRKCSYCPYSVICR